jgi:CO/xanthine dehydrogenase FAD-binding subunit
MGSTEVLTPNNLPELQDALKKATLDSKLLAGGTDLVQAMHEHRCRPDLVIDLSGVKELQLITVEQGQLRIGATTTFSQLQRDHSVRKYALCLAEAAARVGSTQIRNTATIGGNIGNASPAGDTIPVLMALGAIITLRDSRGQTEEKPIDELVTGSGKTSLRYDQVITQIFFPLLDESYRSTFAKIGSRSTVTIAKLNMALIVLYDAGLNTISDVRVGLGAIGVKAFRDTRVDGLLNGRQVDENLARLFVEELSVTVQQAIPGRYSLPYKQEAIKGLAHDAWNNLFK